MYGEASVEKRWVRWSRTDNPGTSSVNDKPRCRRPDIAKSAEERERVNKLIRYNQRIKKGVIASIVGIFLGTVNHVMKGELDLAKVYSRRMPRT